MNHSGEEEEVPPASPSVHPLASVMSPGRKDGTPPPPSHSVLHPLAKTKGRKQKKQVQSSETWADEVIESQSQKMRALSLADHQQRKKDMETQLKAAEAQLVEMKTLLDKREELLKESQEESTPSENGETAEDQSQKKDELGKKFTKKRIQQLREKLQQMELQTDNYLSDIENTMQYLGSLEDASDSLGPLSDETQELINREGTDDFIAKVYAENIPPARKSNNKAKSQDAKKGDNSGDEESGHESDEDDGEVKGSKVFITTMEDEGKAVTTVAPDQNEETESVGKGEYGGS